MVSPGVAGRTATLGSSRSAAAPAKKAELYTDDEGREGPYLTRPLGACSFTD